MKKLIRISTVPTSLNIFLKGQLEMLSEYYEVLAVSSPGLELKELEEREKVRALAIQMERHISLFSDFFSLVRLIKLFAKERPYIVHSITPKAGFLAMVAAFITGVPIRIHTFTGLVFPTSTGRMQKLLIMMDRITCFCATYINPEGEGVKNDLLQFRITSKPLHIIANGNVRGIDLNYYDHTQEVMEKVLKIRVQSTFTFCFVGRLVRDKGINELLAAFNKLYNREASIKLILVGAFEEKFGPLLPETIEWIKHHPGVMYVGRQQDVRPYLAISKVFVFPSYREGFPNGVLEAGAMGLPSIVTDINGSNEIIIPNENGIIIPPRDEKSLLEAMDFFISHPEETKRMASNARKLVASRYEQKIVWSALLKVYQDLIKKSVIDENILDTH